MKLPVMRILSTTLQKSSKVQNPQSSVAIHTRTTMTPIPRPSPAEKIERCETILNYKFFDKRLCLEALQRDAGARVYFSNDWLDIPKNDQLAHHGDTVFDFILSTKWVRERSTSTSLQS
jgi:hypothetical protein